jgi:dethiobiotin synthetase
MTRGVFVAGTDTGVGKTRVAAALLRGAAASGFRAVGMKPVAAGIDPGAALNADVVSLMQAGNVAAPPEDVNPYALGAPIAPHLAAAAARTAIDLDRIVSAYGRLAGRADVVIVEGAGGVFVPIGARGDMLDIAARLRLPVLLVVGMRLGCLNHALLSALAIDARGLRLAGWIANRIDPGMFEVEANVGALAQRLPAPLVADLAWGPESDPLDRASLRMLGLVVGD